MKQVMMVGLCGLLLACGKPASDVQQSTHQATDNPRDQPYQVKPAVKLSTDASALAQKTLSYLQQTEPALSVPITTASQDMLEKLVFTPVRELLVQWRMDVKQTDSVVGDQYTICRGALMSFDVWARTLLERPELAGEKKQLYLNQKQLCEKAVAQGLPSKQW